MKKLFILLFTAVTCLTTSLSTKAQTRRPIDSRHPLWMIHVDVWNAADPQKIIDLIPEDIRPFVCMNLSLSCQYDTEKNIYKMPQNAVRTYKSWGTVCQQNGLWFTCQPASGGHTHLQTTDLETFEYFFRRYPNFLGWNFAEQFWGFDEKNDKSSATQTNQIALFAKLVAMSHQYGGFLTISFCGNIWSHGLNPVGMMKRNSALLKACKDYPEAILWLYKYTTTSCFYNNESVTFGPFIGGLAKNYGVRYDNCGWNGATDVLLGQDNKSTNNIGKYPIAAGIGTVMEQTGVNGGAVWDGPELIWTEDFKEIGKTTVDDFTRRNWTSFEGFNGAWIDMFRKIIDGTLYIPTHEEVVGKTKIVIVNNVTSGSDEEKYAAWGDLYDGIYKQDDPFNKGNGQWMDNMCYFKQTGRYGAIPITPVLYDSVAKTIPVQVKKAVYTTRWSSIAKKKAEFDKEYPGVSTGDLYVNRFRNQLITYTPYTYLNSHATATGHMPLLYNTCDSLHLTLGKLGSSVVREYADHIDFYLNNYRTDTTSLVKETIVITGATTEPTFTLEKRLMAKGSATAEWNAEQGIYTLTVSHLGGMDVRIDCQGNATDRQTDVLPSVALTADLPKQPAEYHGEIIIEAEDMDCKNVKNCTTSPYYSHPDVRGHAGNGFVDMGTNGAGALRHQLSLKESGTYRIQLRYMCTTKSGKIRFTVNGKNTTVTAESTENNEWRKVQIDNVTLKAGKNNLVITNIGGLPMLIDQIIYTPSDIEPEKYLITIRKGTNGTLTADVNEAVEGETVRLTIKATEGYGLKELRVINGVNFTMANTISLETLTDGNSVLTFQMPDDIVTLQPVFAKGVNVVDGITLVDEVESKTSTIYDLSGRNASQSARHKKGIYVKDGKKILMNK